MDIKEMHVWFRQYAQQMGMQNVRAILPEQIDIVLNTSISDTLNEVIRANVELTNDRIITDNSKIGQINALRTLTRSVPVEVNPLTDANAPTFNRALQCITISPFFNGTGRRINDCLYFIDMAVQYGTGDGLYFYEDRPDDYTINPVVLSDSIRTSYYPVRVIESRFLADTLQDFVLKPRLRSPIAVANNTYSGNEIVKDQIEIYFGEDLKKPKLISTPVYPVTLLVNYIAKPAKVQFASDFGGTDVNCNLPETMHVDIIKHAVDLYRLSIQGSLYANQQQQQAQQREVGRNNVRPDNEGYQN